jgi:hypothetical protein
MYVPVTSILFQPVNVNIHYPKTKIWSQDVITDLNSKVAGYRMQILPFTVILVRILILLKYVSETINQHLHYLLALTISAIPSIYSRDAYKAKKAIPGNQRGSNIPHNNKATTDKHISINNARAPGIKARLKT